MSFRQVLVNKETKLKLKNSNLLVVSNENDVLIPLEDIFIIVLDDMASIITTQLINTCAKNKVLIIVCDEKHIPNSIITGFNTNYRQLHILELQFNYPINIKGEIWQQITTGKISNQYEVLKLTTCVESDLELLKKYSKSVKDNDIDNREGIAAKVFFKSIYGSEFIRFYDDAINYALNYGYKILAAAITRELVSLGLDPKIGFWHNSKQNSTNLSYDIIELFRPIIDYFIYENSHEIINEVSFKMRRELINILNARMEYKGKMLTVQNAITEVCKNVLRIYEGKTQKLDIPKICRVEFIIYE